jgi:hypothetical protein
MKPDDLDCELYLTDRHQASLRIDHDGPEHSGRPALDDALLARLRASLDPREYGKMLFEALLPPESELLSGYRQALAVAASAKQRLRFRLHLAANLPAELHSLRWEQLHDSRQELTFGCSREIVFSRYSSVPREKVIEVREKPRLLVALADPSDLAEFGLPTLDRAEARRSIEEALTLAGFLNWEILQGPVTAARLSDRLIAGGFHALHLQAHGLLRPDRASASLLLENGEGKADFVSEDTLNEIFEGARDLRLVTLIACHGGAPSRDEPLSGLGPGLVRRGVPAVVAMRQAIRFSTAASFCQHFYRNLARDGCVDRALNEARHQLSLSLRDSDEWSTPILFMRLRDGLLWRPKSSITKGHRSSEIKWPNLLECIRSDSFVPLLGPGLSRGLLPAPAEIAERWAARYDGFPLDRRTDLPAVAQFIEIKEGCNFPHKKLPALLVEELLAQEPVGERRRFQNLQPSQAIAEIAERHFASDKDEPHCILADLPLSLYVTTTWDGFMASALRRRRGKATVEHCRWREDLMDLPAGYDGSRGTQDEPLVFQMYGSDADPSSLVLTEDDHLEFLRAITAEPQRLPAQLKKRLTQSMLLFLGYDVRRLDCRVLLRGVVAHLKRSQSDRIALLQIDRDEEDAPSGKELKRYMEGCWCKEVQFEVYWGSVSDFLRELRERHEESLRG